MSDKTTPTEPTLIEQINSAVAKAIADINIQDTIDTAVAKAIATIKPATTEVAAPTPKVAVPIASLSFSVGKRKFGFNFPAVRMKNEKGVFTPYTAEEVADESNTTLQASIVEKYDAGETKFIKEL